MLAAFVTRSRTVFQSASSSPWASVAACSWTAARTASRAARSSTSQRPPMASRIRIRSGRRGESKAASAVIAAWRWRDDGRPPASRRSSGRRAVAKSVKNDSLRAWSSGSSVARSPASIRNEPPGRSSPEPSRSCSQAAARLRRAERRDERAAARRRVRARRRERVEEVAGASRRPRALPALRWSASTAASGSGARGASPGSCRRSRSSRRAGSARTGRSSQRAALAATADRAARRARTPRAPRARARAGSRAGSARRRSPAITGSSSPSETSVANSGSRRSVNVTGSSRSSTSLDLPVDLDARAAVAGVERDGHLVARCPRRAAGRRRRAATAA